MAKGHFVWFDLFTTDLAHAQSFYTELFNWKINTMDMGGGFEYPMFAVGERGIAGSMPLPDEAKAMGAPPHWLAYVEVEDVDAAVAKAVELGGKVLREAADMPSVGRWAVLADPQAACSPPSKAKTAPRP